MRGQRRATPEHDRHHNGWRRADENNRRKADPIRSERQPTRPELDPVLQAALPKAPQPQRERQDRKKNDPPVEARDGRRQGGSGRGDRGQECGDLLDEKTRVCQLRASDLLNRARDRRIPVLSAP